MTLRCRRWRSGLSRWLTSGFLLAMAVVAASPAAVAADIQVVLDEAKLETVPDRVATIVVGNPLVADVTIQAGGVMVVTGRGYGMTNLIALDRTGKVLMERTVEVVGPRDNVVVLYRGVDRETYSCAPNCQPRVTPGDGKDYFTQGLAQIGERNSAALGGGTAGPAAPK